MENLVPSKKFMLKKKVLLPMFGLIICLGLTGCDREPPTVSGLDSVIELDCGTDFNLRDYLIENVKITDETDDGTVNYSLSDLEYSVTCDENIYNAETGVFDTEKFGNYDVELSVADKSNNKTKFTFTVKLNPLHLKSSLDETVEMDCGTIFNVNDYFSENLKIVNADETVEYKLADFEYTIDCPEAVYNAASGKLDTSRFGEYDATLTIDSESFENNKAGFEIKLNPLSIEKGHYVYDSPISSSGYDYLGFCEYKNTSAENLMVTSIEFKFYDKDGVMISSNDMPDYSREYVASGDSGYALDTFSSFNSSISSKDEIASVEVEIEYEKTDEADDTSLKVDDMEITNNYDYNVSRFAGTTVITNPFEKDVEYFNLLAGMYDAEGNLIGVMNSMGSNGISALSKARAAAVWLPDSREIPDKVKSLKASARVTLFAEE